MKTSVFQLTVGRLMIVVAVVSILLGGYVLSKRSGYRHLKVVNRSGQAISRLDISVWGERREIGNLADGSSVMVPFWGGEGARFSVSGTLMDKTRVSTSFRLSGDPKRFEQVMGTVEPGGQFRLSLSR